MAVLLADTTITSVKGEIPSINEGMVSVKDTSWLKPLSMLMVNNPDEKSIDVNSSLFGKVKL